MKAVAGKEKIIMSEKMGSNTSRNKEDGIKLQINAVSAEYSMLRSAVFGFRQMIGQLDGLALTALGLSIPLTLTILDRDVNSIGAILLLPILFFAIAFVQLRHERQATLDSTYVHNKLRPKMNDLLSKFSEEEVSVFEYEKFLAETYFPPNFLVQWIITASRAGISIAAGIIITVLCLYLQLVFFKLNWVTYETWLLLIGLIMLVVDLIFAFTTARIFYKFYIQQVK